MAQDAARQRGPRPFVFTNLRSGAGVPEVVEFIREQGLLRTPHSRDTLPV
jgi:urease accessory protein